ncbi:SOS response-associated peptidase [Leucobacter sp. UCMA 4100]|nr:SOS response-associated peptidase [Leucobacter sp. UCMA 4100]
MSYEEAEEHFKLYSFAPELPMPSWNIKPTQDVTVFLEDHKEPGHFRAEAARWALTPVWSKTLATKTPLFNARVETVLEKPSFKASAKSRRCLIPATGYYEWTGEKTARKPHFIHLAEEPILFAGLHSWWHEPDAGNDEGWHLTTTILTMDSYGPMQPIHHRIPVFMTPEMQADWLSPAVEGVPELFEMVAETARSVGELLVEHEVAPLKGDGPELLTAV